MDAYTAKKFIERLGIQSAFQVVVVGASFLPSKYLDSQCVHHRLSKFNRFESLVSKLISYFFWHLHGLVFYLETIGVH